MIRARSVPRAMGAPRSRGWRPGSSVDLRAERTAGDLLLNSGGSPSSSRLRVAATEVVGARYGRPSFRRRRALREEWRSWRSTPARRSRTPSRRREPPALEGPTRGPGRAEVGSWTRRAGRSGNSFAPPAGSRAPSSTLCRPQAVELGTPRSLLRPRLVNSVAGECSWCQPARARALRRRTRACADLDDRLVHE